MAQLMPSKKSVKVSFVTSQTEKMRKKVENFLIFQLLYGVDGTTRLFKFGYVLHAANDIATKEKRKKY